MSYSSKQIPLSTHISLHQLNQELPDGHGRLPDNLDADGSSTVMQRSQVFNLLSAKVAETSLIFSGQSK
jgi:hypothetical protein